VPCPLRREPVRGGPGWELVGREVSLLPRHWIGWRSSPTAHRPALRRLVDQARSAGSGSSRVRFRARCGGTVHVGDGGNLAGYEEATRALYAKTAAG